MTSEGSHIWIPSIEGSSGKLPSSQGIIGRLFCLKVNKVIDLSTGALVGIKVN